MAVQEKLLTAEEFAQLPYDGKKYDLVEGVLIEVCRPNIAHGKLQAEFAYLLKSYVKSHLIGDVVTETGHILARNPDTVRGPDVAFMSKSRLGHDDQSGFYSKGPDLTVEIVSPSDLASELNAKIRQYFRAGTRLVWLVYPVTQEVHVYDGSHTNVKILDNTNVLDGSDVLPGFTLQLSELFQVLGD